MKRKAFGFTLIELLVTMVISGILFVAVGWIIVYANASLKKTIDLTTMVDSYKYAKRKIEYQFRGATTDASDTNIFTKTLPMIVGEQGSDRWVRYISVDRTANAYVRNRFYWDAAQKKIIFETSGPATTNPTTKLITFPPYDPDKEVVMDSVQNAVFAALGGNAYGGTSIAVTVRQAITTGNNETVISTNTFTVKSRNR